MSTAATTAHIYAIWCDTKFFGTICGNKYRDYIAAMRLIAYTSSIKAICVLSSLLSACNAFSVGSKPLSRLPSRRPITTSVLLNMASSPQSDPKQVEKVLFVECGFGADAHGQNPTKAAVRACRNAIEFNQIPSIADIVPGGRDNMKLDVLLAVPSKYQAALDLDPVRESFPYGKVNIQIQDGGMVAQHGKMIETLGDTNEDMIIVCVAVTVGY